jgi:hypothetical protein
VTGASRAWVVVAAEVTGAKTGAVGVVAAAAEEVAAEAM